MEALYTQDAYDMKQPHEDNECRYCGRPLDTGECWECGHVEEDPAHPPAAEVTCAW